MAIPHDTLLFEIGQLAGPKQNPVLLRVILGPDFTRLDFGYTTPWYYVKGGWIKIAPTTYLQLQSTKAKFALKDASGITLAPKRKHFESTADWQFFSLYFEPLPKEPTLIFNMIESEKASPDVFNYEGITLHLKEGVGVVG